MRGYLGVDFGPSSRSQRGARRMPVALDHPLRDARFAFRFFLRNRSFATTAVVLLGLVLGANVAIFSVVRSVLLRPLPFPEPDRLVRLYNNYPQAGIERDGAGAPDYFERRRETDVFTDVAVYRPIARSLAQDSQPRRVQGLEVTPSFFRLLGSEPALGRAFYNDEGLRGRHTRAILSRRLARQLFGDAAKSLGRPLFLDGVAHEVVGVMPPKAVFPHPENDVWVPLAFTDRQRRAQHDNQWEMIARLAPGVTLAAAQERIDALNARQRLDHPSLALLLDSTGFHTQVVELHADLVRDVRQPLELLWGGAVFVLLIGCVSVANLVLVRASHRLKELATRSALGAGRSRVALQLVTESGLLALAGTLVGLALGWIGVRALGLLSLDQIPLSSEVQVDSAVVFAALAGGFAVGMIVGILPLVLLARASTSAVLQERGWGCAAGRSGRLLRRVLVTVQVATAFALLSGAGLLLASFRAVLAVDPGFATDGVLTVSVELPAGRYPDADAQRRYSRRALASIATLPGLEAATLTDTVPLGGAYRDKVILARDRTPRPGEPLLSPNLIVVAPGFFDVLGIPLIEGRDFDRRDRDGAPLTVIIDETLARRFWPGRSALGRQMFFSSNPEDLLAPDERTRWFTVVGVVGDIRLRSLEELHERVGTYYFPYEQSPRPGLHFTLAAADDPAALIEGARSRLAEIDPELPVFGARSLEERRAAALAGRRTAMFLALLFAGVALFLAAVGLYGILAYLVSQRTREIAVRLALGGSRRQVFRLVIDEGLLVLAVGVAAGLGLVAILRQTLARHLYGVGPLQPAVLSLAAAVLVLAALAACCIPAWRATRIPPAVALHK